MRVVSRAREQAERRLAAAEAKDDPQAIAVALETVEFMRAEEAMRVGVRAEAVREGLDLDEYLSLVKRRAAELDQQWARERQK
jgi:hypothetical protein